ncbi:MAG TPA: hypothetical protein VNW95_04955 [Mucilaginibacter sp.]|jgi:hypothetical protein|nr:hypothetical protein [Mucilaginibacter sp.]
MKIIFTLLILLTTGIWAFAQNSPIGTISKALIPPHAKRTHIAGKDTVIESDTSKETKEPRYYYLSALAEVLVNTKGGFGKRFSPGIEFGRTYGIFDIGLATGQIGPGRDTSRYIEFRPTINIFSAGRFAEGLCLGGGYVFGAKQGLITEICNSINFNISSEFAIAVTQGYYFFDGTNSSRSSQYMGFTLTYNFLRPHSVNKQRKKAQLLKE